jgi:MOSC domain-containing protein YiiM
VDATSSAILRPVAHLTTAELDAGLDEIRRSPKDAGTVVLIVARPENGERQELADASLDEEHGLVGDNWAARGSRHTEDGSAEPARQVTLMNARAAALVAVDPARRALAGDQLYVDLDLSDENLPAGTRLQVGSAVLEVTALPHTGCVKFIDRFGADAGRWVNLGNGRQVNARGINATVVTGGRVRAGDVVSRIPR